MNKMELAAGLYDLAVKIGVLGAVACAFDLRVTINIAFSRKTCEVGLDEMDFSVRAMNALKRAGMFNVGDIIDSISSGELVNIRNLGKKTVNEIQTRVFVLGYDRLTEAERRQFFRDLVELNCED